MSCEEALLFLEDVRKRLTVVPLDVEDYVRTISSLAAAGISGGAIYDALLARCAIKSGAEILYTWDVADFRRVAPEIAKQVRTP
jgi:predicted nucleic acid-binding protein